MNTELGNSTYDGTICKEFTLEPINIDGTLHQYTPRVEANTLHAVFQNPMCNSVVYVSNSHLFLKVDIHLCYEQTIHDFTMVILTSHIEGGCTSLEVKKGITHEVYMQLPYTSAGLHGL